METVRVHNCGANWQILVDCLGREQARSWDVSVVDNGVELINVPWNATWLRHEKLCEAAEKLLKAPPAAKVLFYCVQGEVRSACVCACLLVAVVGLPLEAAVAVLEKYRPEVQLHGEMTELRNASARLEEWFLVKFGTDGEPDGERR